MRGRWVEAHGGTIAVDCTNDETTFLIELPVQAQVKAQAREHRPSA